MRDFCCAAGVPLPIWQILRGLAPIFDITRVPAGNGNLEILKFQERKRRRVLRVNAAYLVRYCGLNQ